MRNFLIPRFLALLLALLLAGASQAAQPGGKPLRILFIGNSYTYSNDMPQLLKRLAAASGSARPVEAEAVTGGGVSLQWHWERGEALAALSRKKWDYVVLQEFSTLPLTEPQAMRHYVRLFDERIRSAGARTVLYLTWARATSPQTQAALNDAYYGIGRELGAYVAPVGPAWALAMSAEPRPALYEADHSHPTLAGSYLAAYVFHVLFFGQTPAGRSVPAGLGENEHRVFLTAARAVLPEKIAYQKKGRP